MKKTKLITGISVLATLSTVAPIVITTTSCSKSASLSDSDKTFLNYLNAIIAPLDFEGVPFKAVHAVKNAGINLFEYKFSNQNFQLVLNMEQKKYAVLHNDTILNVDSTISNFDKNRVWKFVDKYDPESEYAQHLNDNYQFDSAQTLEVTGSLDTGTNTNVKKIKYVGTSTQKTTYLRTYTEFLTVEPKTQDDIHHYHYANNVFVTGNGGCHYHEYGRSCYLQPKNTKLSFALTKAKDEPCGVDILEAKDENVTIINQDDGANVYTLVTAIIPKGKTLKTDYTLKIKEITSFDDLIDISEKCLARLTSNINLEASATEVWELGDTTDSLNVVLDLNGHSISTTTQATNQELIRVNFGTLTIMDSAGPDSTGAIKGSRSIMVDSAKIMSTGGIARVIMNGGKIEFGVDLENTTRSAVYVGDETLAGASTYRSEFYMYGGSIEAYNIQQSTSTITAIQTANLGSYAYFVYGDVYGSDGAITTSGVNNSDSSEIEVFGGTLACDDNRTCINLVKQTKLTVYGGSITGGTCIACINSQLYLNGGMFVANGDNVEEFYKDNKLITDGSVIACYWREDTEAHTSTAQPNIISNNVKMYSNKGNILHLGSEESLEPTSSVLKNWMEFISGCYYFNGSVHKEGCLAGMSYDTATYKKFEWLQKGLWNNIPL